MRLKNMGVFVTLVTVGCLQMAGDMMGSTTIKGLGAATHASPAPKVFTAHQGFETFSSRFLIHWSDPKGNKHHLEITPENYSGIRGPYNRRNVFGATLSYGPVLSKNPNTRALFEQVSHYAFCDKAPILKGLGIDTGNVVYPIDVELQPREPLRADQQWQLRYSINCDSSVKEESEHA